MCLSGISFLPLNNIMKPDELKEMSSKLKRRSEERSQDASMTPGLKMQWDLRLQKYQDAKSGNCELIFFPLYYGGSKYYIVNSRMIEAYVFIRA